MSDPTHEQHDECGVEEGACGVDGGFEVFASRRLRPIHAKNRSTTQRRGLTAKPT
jgi:hypothetical protein